MAESSKKIREIVGRYIYQVVFGFQDSLVSTLGAIIGIAEGSRDRFVVILSGLVIIFVESLSMGLGTYISSKSEREVKEGMYPRRRFFARTEQSAEALDARRGLVMFVSYVIGGFLPLLPFFFMPVMAAIFPSILFTIVALFLLGALKTKFTGKLWWKSGLEIAVLCFAAIVVGYAVGRMAGEYLK
ncbi:MAG: VIT1/CCC1 transporter family protein [Patescibacteria group bacterium]|nr:VIT1/CCC1 transporter family protein [Patescibacteria group bacterium]